MKKYFGLLILVIVLVLATGCTQTPASAPATTAPTTVETTAAATVMTTETTTEMTTVAPTAEMTMVANVTQPPTTAEVSNVTMAETTVQPAVTKLVTANVFHITNGSFVPSATTLLPGMGVSWINNDNVTHSVKSTGANAGMFNSGDILPGGQFTYSFGATEGTYTFNDPKFPNMTGTIIIKAGASVVGY